MVRLLTVTVGGYVCPGLRMRHVGVSAVGALRYEERGRATSMDAKESRHENVCDDCKHELVSSIVDVKPFLIEIYVEQNSNIRIL